MDRDRSFPHRFRRRQRLPEPLSSTLLAGFLLLLLPATAAPQAPAGGKSFSLRSPYSMPAKSRQLLDASAVRIALELDYAEEAAAARPRKTAGLPGVRAAAFLARPGATGGVRVLEVALFDYPGGGHQIQVWGVESGGGEARPNPDLAAAESLLRELVAELERSREEVGPAKFGDPGNRFASYKLSYLQSDRATGLLKALGYSVIEFKTNPKDEPLVYDRIFSTPEAELELPVVIRLIDSDKTSLLQPPLEPAKRAASPAGRGADKSTLKLGGLFLDQITTGVPQQRLLIVYDGADPEPMEVLLNLLRTEIDVAAQQILIEALVIELDRDKMKDVGVEFEGSKDGSSFSFLTDNAGFAEPFTYSFKRPSLKTLLDLNVTVKALVSSGHAKVLSRPSVLVLDGRQARIQVGEKIPFTSNISATNTGTLSSTDYLTTGIVLNLRPRISEDGSQITMQVETLISSAGTSGFVAETGVLVAPPIQSREVQTLVRVANDTPFIIGGLIATSEQDAVSGIPWLSKIPGLGAAFRKKTRNETTKEVIVVITPHVIPADDTTFTYVIPKDSSIFDSFGKEVFRNVYRIQSSDLFDLSFVHESQVLADLKARTEARAEIEPGLANEETFRSLLAGEAPGEDILVRRMLFEVVLTKRFQEHVDPGKIFFFPDTGDQAGLEFTLLAPQLASAGGDALVMSFERAGETTMARPFAPPRGLVTIEPLAELNEQYFRERLRAGNPYAGGAYERNTLLLTDDIPGMTPPLERLRAVLVLKRLLELNAELPLSLRGFHVGLELVFPSIADLNARFHLIDRQAAKLFYETEDYYLAFERRFSFETRQILERLEGGVKLTSAAAPPPAEPAAAVTAPPERAFVSPPAAEAPAAPPALAASPPGTGAGRYAVVLETAAPCLNVRAQPEGGAPVLQCLPPGTRVAVGDRRQAWSRVRLAGGGDGWLASAYMTPAGG